MSGHGSSLLDERVKDLQEQRPGCWPSYDEHTSRQREALDLARVQRIDSELNEGDVLVVIRFPEYAPFINCRGDKWKTKQFRMQSGKLLDTGSTVFRDLLSDKAQTRVRRRLGLKAIDARFRFVIDLTPSDEGDDVASDLELLSLPEGVRNWWTSYERLRISQFLVAGHDEHCPDHINVPIVCHDSIDNVHNTGTPENCSTSVPITPWVSLDHVMRPKARDIDDYCPIRHRAAIMRLLLAIHGYDIVINSAPRAYTMAGVAKSLDCVNVVRDAVLGWVMAEPNIYFVDINPEAALRMGWILKLGTLTRAAFRILVSEKTIAMLRAPVDVQQLFIHDSLHDTMVFGRPCGAVLDEHLTSIQYASSKLNERIQGEYGRLTSRRVYDSLGLLEWAKWKKTGDYLEAESDLGVRAGVSSILTGNSVHDELLRLYHRLDNELLQLMDDAVNEALTFTPPQHELKGFDGDRSCYIPRSCLTPTASIYEKLSGPERLLTPCFWQKLQLIVLDGQCTRDALRPRIDEFNSALAKGARCGRFPRLWSYDIKTLEFDLSKFDEQLASVFGPLCGNWASPDLEIPLQRTRHLVLALSDEEFQYLPLWAGGLDDGTGGAFEPVIPDAELGPMGPGPSFNTGYSVRTEVSTIGRSSPTVNESLANTMAAGGSFAANQSTSDSFIPSVAGQLANHKEDDEKATPGKAQSVTPPVAGELASHKEDDKRAVPGRVQSIASLDADQLSIDRDDDKEILSEEAQSAASLSEDGDAGEWDDIAKSTIGSTWSWSVVDDS